MSNNGRDGRGKQDGRGEATASEQELRRLCEQEDWRGAVNRIIELHGPEIRRFMFSTLFQQDRVDDAFGHFEECVTRGLPRFRWECSLRTWLFTVARNSCHHLRQGPGWREQLMNNTTAFPEAVCRPRTETEPWRRTSVKERFWSMLRERLDMDELTLLNLRVVQKQSWRDIARIMSGSAEPRSEAELDRQAAALRQQFQRLKARLRDLATEEGLVPREEPPEPRRPGPLVH